YGFAVGRGGKESHGGGDRPDAVGIASVSLSGVGGRGQRARSENEQRKSGRTDRARQAGSESCGSQVRENVGSNGGRMDFGDHGVLRGRMAGVPQSVIYPLWNLRGLCGEFFIRCDEY